MSDEPVGIWTKFNKSAADRWSKIPNAIVEEKEIENEDNEILNEADMFDMNPDDVIDEDEIDEEDESPTETSSE